MAGIPFPGRVRYILGRAAWLQHVSGLDGGHSSLDVGHTVRALKDRTWNEFAEGLASSCLPPRGTMMELITLANGIPGQGIWRRLGVPPLLGKGQQVIPCGAFGQIR